MHRASRVYSLILFGPYLLWPNGWMDRYATWYGGKPRPRRRCVRRVAAPPLKGDSPQFSVHVYLGQMAVWMKTPSAWYGSRRRPRTHCIRRGPSSTPPAKGTQPPPPSFRLMLLWSRSSISATGELLS